MRGATFFFSGGVFYWDEFQSTRPMRGATFVAFAVRAARLVFQSTRPMRGATVAVDGGVQVVLISIHAPHAGRDAHQDRRLSLCHHFNPRAPCGARRHHRRGERGGGINFNPRAPCGARPRFASPRTAASRFQSTRPMRGATAKVNKLLCTFLQKRHGFQIFLRKTLPFKAFCRLQIGKNFSICGANRCGNFCELLLRTIRSSVLPEGRSACSQNAQFYSHTFSRDNRNADCLFPDP